ncbi:hypothetical protein DWB63_13500, partial [Pseudodesulfovibrio sp. S3]
RQMVIMDSPLSLPKLFVAASRKTFFMERLGGQRHPTATIPLQYHWSALDANGIQQQLSHPDTLERFGCQRHPTAALFPLTR